jgi:hypothetical protein
VGTKAINAGQMPNCFKTFGLVNILSLPRGDGTFYGLSVFFLIILAVILAPGSSCASPSWAG